MRERGVQCIAGSRVLGSLKLDADLSPTAPLRREAGQHGEGTPASVSARPHYGFARPQCGAELADGVAGRRLGRRLPALINAFEAALSRPSRN